MNSYPQTATTHDDWLAAVLGDEEIPVVTVAEQPAPRKPVAVAAPAVKGPWLTALIVAVQSLLLVVALGAVVWLGTRPQPAPQIVVERKEEKKADVEPVVIKEKTFADIYAAATPSIVRVRMSGTVADEKNPATHKALTGGGTGFFVDGAGHLVTNAHVVRPWWFTWVSEPAVRVELADGRTLTAEIICRDQASDLAVLRVTGDKLPPPLPFADVKDIKVGVDVAVIGYALDLAGPPSLTCGIVSGLERTYSLGEYAGAVQTNAAINHGNSGGPMLNRAGKVIGVNTAIELGEALKTGKAVPDPVQGIFYARSAATAEPMVKRMIAERKLRRGDLGVRVETVTPNGNPFVTQHGARIKSFPSLEADGNPAKTALLQYGDVITKIDGQPIRCAGEFNDVLFSLRPGQKVKVDYERLRATTLSAKPMTLDLGRPTLPAPTFTIPVRMQAEMTLR